MQLVQFLSDDGARKVGLVGEDGDTLIVLRGTNSLRELALEAAHQGLPLRSAVQSRLTDLTVNYAQLIDEGRMLPSLDHPDPAHCHVSGTGLTHLGSARARDSMHAKSADQKETPITDSMLLFHAGLEAGKPEAGQISVQPEWFYKGNGFCVVAPEAPLTRPAFALDGGEEAELVGLYVISENGEVFRIGFALGNEFSDHVMARQNYLYLAHSKLRSCSFGPEVLVGDLPTDIQGNVRIVRSGTELWSAPFLTGESNMSYSIQQLEHHHFKYPMFRQPGDVHCHFLGTATLSFSEGVQAQSGDRFEIFAPPFRKPLRNPIHIDEEHSSFFPAKAL